MQARVNLALSSNFLSRQFQSCESTSPFCAPYQTRLHQALVESFTCKRRSTRNHAGLQFDDAGLSSQLQTRSGLELWRFTEASHQG